MRRAIILAVLFALPFAHATLISDVDGDGTVNLQDLLVVLQHLGRSKAYDASADLNNDGAVNLFDLVTVSRDWGKTSPSNNTLPAGLILGYSFDDGTATDISGNSLHGVVSGATSVQGQYGGALSFDGVNDYIDVGSQPIVGDLPSMTVTMWVKSSGNGYLISKRDTCSGYWRLDLTNGNINWLNLRGGINAQSNTLVAANSWTHIAVTWDGTNTSTGTRLYIDGVEVTNPGAASTAQSDASCSLRIGSREGTSSFYSGQLDEVRLYSRALNTAEITADMNTPFGGNYNPPADTMPPQLSNAQPSGTLSTGTTSVTLRVTTDEEATCKYSTTAGQTYASMPNTFTTTGGTSHSGAVSGLIEGQIYRYYVRCQDDNGNANSNDLAISFSITPAGGVQPLFSDDFENGKTSANGFTWSGGLPVVSGTAYSGSSAMRFRYNPASTHQLASAATAGSPTITIDFDPDTYGTFSYARFILDPSGPKEETHYVRSASRSSITDNGDGTWTVLLGDTAGNPTTLSNSHAAGANYQYNPRSHPNGDNNQEQRFIITPNASTAPTEVWVEYMWRVPDNWAVRSLGNNKFFTVWAETYSGLNDAQFYLTLDPQVALTSSRVDIQSIHGDDPRRGNYRVYGPTAFVSEADRGQWVQVRIHARLATDGEVQVYRDGTLYSELIDYNMVYAAHSLNYFRHGYLMGWSNSGYTEQTDFYIDDFKIYTQNPGW